MQLHFYNEQFRNAIENYKLTEEQLHYTGHPNECIELSNKDSDRHSILAIEDEKLVTFFVLHKSEEVVKLYSNNNNSILLRSFSTDSRYQGMGYATRALMLLPEFIKKHFNGTDEIVLAVNVKNEAAQRLYKRCRFIDSGVRKMGSKGELILMSYLLF